MRSAPARSIGRSCVLLFALTAARQSPATTVLLPIGDLEPQYASQLCWAAVDTIAVNSFFPSCGTTAPIGTSQSTEAAYGKLGITSATLPSWLAAPSGSTKAMQLQSLLSACATNIQACNQSGIPILPGLTYQTNTNSMGLAWTEAVQQLQAGRPFLFVWKYPSGGLHQLIAIGYSDDSGEKLTIWDPLPIPDELPKSVPACGALALSTLGMTAKQLKSEHESQIDFSVYADPDADEGVAADHLLDQYDLARIEQPNPPGNLQIESLMRPAPPTPGTPAAARPASEPFAPALRNARKEGERVLDLLHREHRSGGRLSLGTPFAVVGVGLDELRATGGDPKVLLTQTTSAVLFPVLANGAVVDSFTVLLRRGRWTRGGYSNTAVADRLVQVRARYAKARHLPDRDLYMVSVPGREAFFAAYGVGNMAVLIPASNDPSIGATAGKAEPAMQQLGRLAAAVRIPRPPGTPAPRAP
ncbi:MAG TPA: hypothetical protein VMG11_05205 [Steroidobacteraceae bacterium]|nr:hypothetical protein [Steroidobacteraceae bacterium]